MFEMSRDERSKKAGGGAFASLARPADGFLSLGPLIKGTSQITSLIYSSAEYNSYGVLSFPNKSY